MPTRPQIGTKLTVAERKQLREKYTPLATASGARESVFDDVIALLDDLDAIDAAPEHVIAWEKPLIVDGVDFPLTVMQGRRVADAYAAHEAEVHALREAEYNARRKAAIAESSGQMTLGDLIAAIAQCPTASRGEKPYDYHVTFDFGGIPDLGVESYRGFYEHAAIGWTDRDRVQVDKRPTVAEFLKELTLAVDSERTGYKGGEYTMHADVPVWCANYGDASSCAIVGVSQRYEDGGDVILHTRYVNT